MSMLCDIFLSKCVGAHKLKILENSGEIIPLGWSPCLHMIAAKLQPLLGKNKIYKMTAFKIVLIFPHKHVTTVLYIFTFEDKYIL